MSRQSQHRRFRPFGALALGGALALASVGAAQAAPADPEDLGNATIPAPSADWFYVRGGFGSDGTYIVNSATGKMVGLINTSGYSDLAIDPAGKAYYVGETIWSRGNRGTRQDIVSVYDSKTLKLETEIPVPGRLIIGAQSNDFVLSQDGKTGYLFNLTPATSVNIVDMVKRKFVKNVDLPGCAGLMPINEGLVALCSDGSLATMNLTGGKAEIIRTASFFKPSVDPVYDAFNYSIAKKEAVFISYTGLIYTAKIGAKPEVAEPFSIQVAAGVRQGDTRPLDVNWFPGGRGLTAWHVASNHLYVLMHIGEYWTQKEGASEVWDVDLTAKKVVKRLPVEGKITNIAVTQGDKPKLFMSNDRDAAYIVDLATWTKTPKLEGLGGGIIATLETK